MVTNPASPNTDDTTEISGLGRSDRAGDAFAPGAQFGVYTIKLLLGEGGMGRVYLAGQTRPVRRDVALKLIREQVESPLARAYFDVESQALAQMQHPAIAQVFDAGTTAEGHPYIAMELVEGVPLTRFCREEKLSLAERLALFTRVCHGVQHAHQKGVIHRDLKPANVLVRRVDGLPAPKIIDFGIAIGGAPGAQGAVADAVALEQRRYRDLHESGTTFAAHTRSRHAQRCLFARRDALRSADGQRRLRADVCRAPLGARAAGHAARRPRRFQRRIARAHRRDPERAGRTARRSAHRARSRIATNVTTRRSRLPKISTATANIGRSRRCRRAGCMRRACSCVGIGSALRRRRSSSQR